MHAQSLRPTYAPKVPVGWIVRLYESDAAGYQDDTLAEKVGWRLHARCADVVMVSDAQVACPVCHTVFPVPWIGVPAEQIAGCPICGWRITAGDYHASIAHRDLLGINARDAFAAFVADFPIARSYRAQMLLIDRVVHALHTSGNVAARNLLEGHPRRVLATLDKLAGR